MKKISMILMAFALTLTMSQCKKNEVQPTSNDEVVTITLDVTKNNSSRVVVNPSTGTVDFETGDKIYVGSGGKYVGFLIHNGTNFVGNITNPTENQPLQFYFLGNVTPAETLAAGTTEECSVIISDQTEHLPVISCAASYENYVSGVTAYSAHLLNKCALVKFNVTTPSNSPICITGMKNKVTVDFTQNEVTPSIDGDGVIELPAGSGENVEKWAILLPQEALEEGEEGSAYSEDEIYSGTRPEIPTITENGYLAEGFDVVLGNAVSPVGAINGLFTIDGDGNHVYFSQGNLQYQASTDVWKFAEQQWDIIGEANNNISSAYEGWIDLFGWGTSGYNHGAMCYTPYSNLQTNNYYYAYGSPTYNLNDSTGMADWGYNPISNGGNQSNQWRTLTSVEWEFVFDTRTTATGIRYARANVNNVNGVILLPDDWDGTYYALNNTNQNNANYTCNEITISQWSIMEEHGAVFIPVAGCRIGIQYYRGGGDYWSASSYSNNYAYLMWFNNSELTSQGYNSRFVGRSVRLVQDYNP